jgi:hypothetical protein
MTDNKKDNWIIKMLRAVKAFFDNPDKKMKPMLTVKELELNSPPKQPPFVAEPPMLSPALEEFIKLAKELKQATPTEQAALIAKQMAILDELVKQDGLKIDDKPSSPENRSVSSSPIEYRPPTSGLSPWGR